MTRATQRLVWVVDDSSFDADRARRVLSAECRVEVFPDGAAALERLAAVSPPDVMVLDWVMPGVTGVDVCRFLRSAQGGHPEV
ncbi:MAG TPA: response regulator, partial [Polyangiales bacterium]|nr:response regulator [Polyangiales bacterium]